MKYILVATSNSEAISMIKSSFETDFRIKTANSLKSCLELYQKERPEYFFIDLQFLNASSEPGTFKSHFQTFWRVFPTVEIVVLCKQEMVRQAVQAVKEGAINYLLYPLDSNELKLVVEHIDENFRMRSELDYLRDKSWRGESFAMLRTTSSIMQEVFNKVRAVAGTQSTVLLTGETGTGKGVIASLIHQQSSRRDKQFISIHCGAIPDTLLESELFGHEKGAFTGSVRRKLGKFEIANNGTIFLDEIGTISGTMQIKLLQVLQDRTFQRLGGETTLESNARVIAATNADLQEMCKNGTFRQDLYYRFNVFPIEIPPLRDRKDDIPLLVEEFLKRLNRFNSKNIRGVDDEVLSSLREYSWPGNIRELQNLIERAHILETSATLTAKSFPWELIEMKGEISSGKSSGDDSLEAVRKREIARIERKYLIEKLREFHGKINATAAAAGVGVRQLHKLMNKYGLRKEDFKN